MKATIQNLKPSPKYRLKDITTRQRATLEKWLFKDNLSYRAVIKLCAEKFKIKVGVNSILNFYRKQFKERTITRILNSSHQANEVMKAIKENPSDIYHALLNVIGQIAFEKAIGEPEQADLATIREFTKLLISARQEHVADKRVAQDREKWEFQIARACLKHLAQLQTIAANNDIDEDARLLAIRHRLFGPDLPE